MTPSCSSEEMEKHSSEPHHHHAREWLSKPCHKAGKFIKGRFCHDHQLGDSQQKTVKPQTSTKTCDPISQAKKDAQRREEWERYKAIQVMGVDSHDSRRYVRSLGC
ncbi:uncharacterized protein BCR38DRAFT_413543 [Pseudomassariella vexata]|uniref:Uncharacterized protein n=1 Tax=Pseudomassariella vexata TaxID=1141098 RepID=A0A1Y2DFU6_9PEZI|nr:uncharacterized protein BCR38DRAFT_413543 [Pseudomassariella vexata]ORY58138.1 hypothetical protein BCR38DRAFT_413543 [Pseudomassariella vexata]